MIRFWLIRHGAHDWLGRTLVGRQTGISLNKQGKEEAQLIARALARRPLSMVCSSPMQRALETAEPLADALELRISIRSELDEIDFGEWTGRTFAELDTDSRWREWNAHRASAACPAGESMRGVQKRILDFMGTLAQAHEGTEIALVSHGDVLRAALAHHLHVALDRMQTIPFEPGAVALIEFGGNSDSSVQIHSDPASLSEALEAQTRRSPTQVAA
jgi:broad specificity phosphatase PhoE